MAKKLKVSWNLTLNFCLVSNKTYLEAGSMLSTRWGLNKLKSLGRWWWGDLVANTSGIFGQGPGSLIASAMLPANADCLFAPVFIINAPPQLFSFSCLFNKSTCIFWRKWLWTSAFYYSFLTSTSEDDQSQRRAVPTTDHYLSFNLIVIPEELEVFGWSRPALSL